ncbi:transcription initiation factor TFIID subunit 3 [Eurytemora carolleeae]|uniref:transcription initiation factor TFIID subunit 3 n=1 Tax=Eurytemora carolleeae TaxID=1294199 RepID=UPI000C77C344|nr:transcription initiation factor TFIID subunit 3 [Eurytemora carolleeae]|eukprot:XP_023323799.1 transcription initiation factor TFIID subunit 3-like [Eurytemora affinis]
MILGVEIEDILQSGFDGEEGYTLSPISTGSTQSRLNKTKGSPVGKNKKSRNKSTDNLHPNLLPEDYLDEVIGQYFNTESSGEDEEKETKKPVKKSKKSDSEDSTDDDVLEAKVRLRPPASFYSMDFLDDLEAEVGKKEKVKTELELEVEYKHILYGGKKKKPVKLGLGKKKKKKEDSKETTESKKPGVKKTKRKGRRKVVKKHDPVPEPAEPVLPRTRSSGPVPASPSPILSSSRSSTRATNPTSPIPSSSRSSIRSTSHLSSARSSSKPSPTKQINLSFSPTPSEPLPSHAWSGKKASTKAYAREDMRERIKRPFTSSKIEDVTGKYGEEEELVSCGICDQIDPPHEDLSLDEVEVEWVGCDCFRWFHKPCTKLMKFTEKFSCRSVKMKCLETPPAPVKIKPVLPVVKMAVVKFVPDIPRFFIKNI